MTDTPNTTQGKSAADDRIRTHARTIVEGEGAEEYAPGVDALIKRLRERLQIRWSCPDRDGDIHQMVEREDLADAIVILSTIRKHQAGE